jgi:alpha-methylacyl-CoA racemase
MTNALKGALDGVRVVALATNIPGPLAAARLRELGATVVKIEPLRGDALERSAPRWYAEIVAGMDVRKLDLRAADARAALHAALRDADVLITATRASALERLGLSRDEVRAGYPRLVHVAVVGEAPPNDDRAGHDLTYQARAGLLAPPEMPRTVASDLAAAEHATSAALAALFARERNGRGSRIDVAIVDAAYELSAPLRFGLTSSDGPLGGALPAYGLYRASDGWIALAALEEHFVERTCALLGVERLDEATLRGAFAARGADEWERLAEGHDVPLAKVHAWK